MRISTYAVVGILSIAPAAVAQTAPKAKVIQVAGSGYMGVNVQEIDSERAKALKLREEAGVEITSVTPDSPAEKAGLKSGDAILQYNGQRVEGHEQFSRLVRETPAGREVKLEISRNGSTQTIPVKLGTRQASAYSMLTPMPTVVAPRGFEFKNVMPDMPRSFMSWQSSILGVDAESLDGQLAQFFGVKEGVLVRSVNSGSAAEKGGLKAGDVIIKVDDSKVTTPAEISSHLRSMQGKQVSIVVMRDHKEMTLTVALDENHRAEWWQDFVGSNNWVQMPGDVQILFGNPSHTPRVISWP